MGAKLLEIKNRSYYFWDDTIYIENFNPELLKIDKKISSIGINIYYIQWITKKPVYNINSVNPLYLVIKAIDGYVEERENGDKYLNTSPVKDNDEVLKIYADLWVKIKTLVLKTNGSVEEYNKDYQKIKFDSDISLPLHTLIKFHALKVVIRGIIEKDGKYYPEIY